MGDSSRSSLLDMMPFQQGEKKPLEHQRSRRKMSMKGSVKRSRSLKLNSQSSGNTDSGEQEKKQCWAGLSTWKSPIDQVQDLRKGKPS